MTRTVTAGPSLLRGGFSSARNVPSGSALTGRSANEAEARHRMCAPVASTARARDHNRNCRSASTSIPGPKQPSRSAASDCSASVHRPMAAPSMLPVPDSAAATHRTCGNAPSRDWFDGRPLAPGPSSGKTYTNELAVVC
jgi:Tfp pilus assembly protein FimV